MELLELYKKENRGILSTISWLNKNSIFDKSIGSFQEIDLFTFLENINKYDYKKDIFYDDVYYILEYTEETILNIMKNINKEIKREHKIMPISQAKEFDRTSILWLSRKNGRTIKEKLSNGKIKAVQRYSNVDTYENRIFKILLKKLISIHEQRDDLEKFEHLFVKIRKWLKSDEAKSIDEYKKIVYNNILLHHKHYSKIFKSYKKLNSLNEKLEKYYKIYPEQTRKILKFEILSQLQFKSKENIFPRSLEIDYKDNEFNLKVEDCLLNLNLNETVSKITTNILEKKLPFQFINKFSEQIITKQLKIKVNEDRAFRLNTKEEVEKVYLDLFRLFPIAKLNKKTVKFPIILKQKIDNKVINANNTKIINLDEELYTLPEILKSYDSDKLKYFLDDFDKYFKNKQLNYIIPDYVNIFEFSQVKRLISSYFKNSKSIPKSILAGFSYIDRNEVKVNDTLLYLQKNYDDELFVTPLLIKLNPKLKKITNGLYIERHPTRKIEGSNQELIASLSKIFSKKIAEELIFKFLRNGIKGIKNEKIVFYQDEKIIDLNRLQLPNSKYTNIINLKKIYSGKKSLFKAEHRFISDETNENLDNFEKISDYEEEGFMLWREHLPDLSMEIVKNGYFDKFVLVDENSRIENKIIEIKEKFLIPADVRELSFPLYLDNQNIGFKAEVTSKQFPFKNDVECTLELTYDYERETPYELTFKPLDKELKDIKVKWIKEVDKEYEELIYPIYPIIQKNRAEIEQKLVQEFKQLEKDFKAVRGNRFYNKDYYFLKKPYSKAMLSEYWKDGNSIMNSQNEELKRLLTFSIKEFITFKDTLPKELKNNIFLFLSYLHKDLILKDKNDIFIIKEFTKKVHLYGLSLGAIDTSWQKTLFKNLFKEELLKQVKILNIALWRSESVIENIGIKNLEKLLNFINQELKFSKNEQNIVNYLEFLLASLRTKQNSEILYPNKVLTKNILNTLKDRSEYLVKNYELKSKINFGQIDKPDNLSKMPDILYAVIYYLSNEDIENKIIINGVTS